MNEVKDKIRNFANLVTTSALTAVENKIASVNNFVKKKKKKKNGYNTEVNKIGKKIANHNHDNYISIPEFYKFSKEIFGLRLSRANFASQGYIFNFVNMTDFDNQGKNVTSNKNELNEPSKNVKAILTKGLTKDLIDKLSILNGAKYVSLGIFQN